MRKLTLKSYLKKYIKDLNNCDTLSIPKLAGKCKKEKRLIDPLILYSLLSDKDQILMKDDFFRHEMKGMNKGNYLDEKFGKHGFKKILASYENTINKNHYDNEIKRKIYKMIKPIMSKKQISNYYIYKTLKLNHGNANDFLSNGNCKKLSLKNVRRIYDLVISY